MNDNALTLFFENCCNDEIDFDDIDIQSLDDDHIERGIERAAEYNHIDVIRWILEETQDRNLFLNCAISEAIRHNNFPLVQLLCEAKQSQKYFTCDYDDATFLFNACFVDNPDMVRYFLLKHGVNNWNLESRIKSMLDVIYEADAPAVLAYLLTEPLIQPYLTYDKGASLKIALEAKAYDYAQQLLKSECYPHYNVHNHVFIQAIKQKDHDLMHFLLNIKNHGRLTLSPSDFLFSDLNEIPEIKTNLMLLWKQEDYLSYIEILPEFTQWCHACGHETILHRVLHAECGTSCGSEISLHL